MFEIGSSLREARLRQSVELPEAEAGTKIRSKYLRALEDEQFAVLPAQTYVKGFLRAYAEFLGLDGQLYVDEYNSRYVSGVEDEPLVRPRRGGGGGRPSTAHRRIESSVVALALIGIATAAALVIVAWKWGGESPRTLPGLDGSGAPVQTTAAPPPARTQPFSVELVATRGPTWVSVRRGSQTGPVLFDGTIDKGKSQGFTQKRVWLNVAVPRNLVVKVAGRRLGVLKNEVVIVSPTGVRPVAS